MSAKMVSKEFENEIKEKYEYIRCESKSMDLYYKGERIKEKEWTLVYTEGNDCKYGRWAYSDKLKQYRTQINAEEFYGGAPWD